jgi:arginyl-tRNA synthetase
MSPATVANYLFDLAKGYNQLYQELPVLKEDRHEKVILRLIIASLTGSIIKKAMCLLGIEVPNKM